MVASVLSSLRVRLVLLVLFALIPAFGLILWTNLEQRGEDRTHAEENVLSLARVTGAQQEQLIEGGRQFLGTLVGLVSASQTNQAIDPASCSRALAALLAQNPRYANIGMADAQGMIFCSGLPQSQPTDASQRTWFERALQAKQFAVGDYQIGTITKKQSINFGYPVLDQQGNVRLVIFAALDLSWLNDQAARVALPSGAILGMWDPHGVVLLRSEDSAKWVGHGAGDLPLFQTIAARKEGTTEAKGLDGVNRLYSFTPLGDPAQPYAYVSVGISTASVFGGANSTLYRNLGLLGVVTLLALAAAWFVGDRLVVRNVRALARAAQRIQSGDLSARSGLRYDRGEIGQLAWTFDETAQALEEREAARQRAEEALRESEERFRLSVEKVEDYAIFMLDPDGLVASWNAGAERIKGYRAEEIIGQHVSRFYPLENIREGKPERDLRIAEEEGRAEHECWRVRKDGSRFWASVVTTAMRDERGELRGFSKVTRDLTSQKRAESALQRTMEDLQRSNTELEQFAYVASHDLQEPLRMVANYTQLLARRYEGKLDADADDFIGYAVEGAKRMQTLIDDLLAFSRVGTRGKEPSEIDAEAVLARTLRDLEAAATEAGAEVTHDPLPTVIADDGQLGQLFQNLIGNAIKFHGEAPPRVHVSAERNGNGYVFSVKDNGIGIDPEYFDRIFVIFQRLHGREQYPGTGMGLAICKKIVERHGGRIWVESESGQGTTFLFIMPAPSDAQAAA